MRVGFGLEVSFLGIFIEGGITVRELIGVFVWFCVGLGIGCRWGGSV